MEVAATLVNALLLVVVAFVGGTLGLRRFEAIERSIAELRTELKRDIAELRTELKGDIAELRTELKADIGAVRTDLKGDIAASRSELNAKPSRASSRADADALGLDARRARGWSTRGGGIRVGPK